MVEDTRSRVDGYWKTPELWAAAAYLGEEAGELFKACLRIERNGDLRTRSDDEVDKAPREVGQVLGMAATTATQANLRLNHTYVSPTTPFRDAVRLNKHAAELVDRVLGGYRPDVDHLELICALAVNVGHGMGIDPMAEVRKWLDEVEEKVERLRAADLAKMLPDIDREMNGT